MSGIDVIKASLAQSKQWFLLLVADMSDAPTVTAIPGNGPHALWILGHVIHSEAGIVAKFVLGKTDPLPEWAPVFGMGSEPVPDAGRYPPMDELIAEYERVRGKTLEVLDALSDAELARPSKAPPELKTVFETVGQCFNMLSLHTSFHAGQVADIRRAAGRKPVFG